MENQNKNGNIIAIITMMFLYAMISFVTNLAAPIGVIWKNVFADKTSSNTGEGSLLVTNLGEQLACGYTHEEIS